MKTFFQSRALWAPLGATFVFLTSSGVASGQTETHPDLPQVLSFVSDGEPVKINDLNISITPPQGWQVSQAPAGMSLVMHQPYPKNQAPAYDSPKFRRNITVVTKHTPTPIDAKAAERLVHDLSAAMKEDAVAKEFQVLEHKFFNYRGENDGIVLYSSLILRDTPMMQMHVLISGSEQQFLLTYTDMADDFTSNQDAFQTAWNTINSIEVQGVAPIRYRQLMQYGGLGFAGLLLAYIFWMLAKRRGNEYAALANKIYEDDGQWEDETPLTQTGVWRLDATGDIVSFCSGGQDNRSTVSGGW